MILGDLLEKWRKEAELLKRRGLLEAGAIIESLSDELEANVREINAGTVNLVEASRLSGYSVSQLGRLVRSGKIPNAGRPKAPRIRLSDVPKKAGCAPSDMPVPVVDFQQRRQRSGRDVDRVGGRVRLHRRHLET